MRTAHQARGIAAAHRGARQAAGDQFLHQFVRTLAAVVGRHALGAQEFPHRIAELEADAAVQVADALAVPVEAAAARAHQHVGIEVHALGGVDPRVGRARGHARIGAERHALAVETDREGPADLVRLELLEAALPGHALVIESDAGAFRDLGQQFEVQPAAIEGAPGPHLLALETQGEVFTRRGLHPGMRKQATDGQGGKQVAAHGKLARGMVERTTQVCHQKFPNNIKNEDSAWKTTAPVARCVMLQGRIR